MPTLKSEMGAKPLKSGVQGATVAVVAALFGLLVWKLVSQGNGGVAKTVDTGKIAVAPGWKLPRLDGGGTLSLAALRGKPVVLNFWASWCEPCKIEAPVLEQASQKYAADGVAFIGVDMEDFKSDARSFVKRYDVSYTIVRGSRALWEPYGLTGYPETFFVDGSGKVVGHYAGQIDVKQVDEGVKRALAR